MRKTLRNVVLAGVALLLGAALWVYAGVFNVAADEPHWRFTSSFLETMRMRSIERRASALDVPNLDSEALQLKGAGQYAEMCVNCHLAPGVRDTPTRQGLYPQPPLLADPDHALDPGAAFWVIKHGIKMTGMPAWGASHDDSMIWSMVAFLRVLPRLTPGEYKALVAKAPPDDATRETNGMPPGQHQAGAESKGPVH